jgi:acyl-coenzyme A thioesterase PaaI-like protein
VEPERSAPGIGPLAGLLGVRRRRLAGGEACLELIVRLDHMNPSGVRPGGVVHTLVDYAMGAALVMRLEPGERCALELKIGRAATKSGNITRALHERVLRLAPRRPAGVASRPARDRRCGDGRPGGRDGVAARWGRRGGTA